MTKSVLVVVQRQLQSMTSGNDSYLHTCMRVAKRAGLRTKVVFAPWRTFSNRPWAKFHPEYQAVFDEHVWPKSIRLGNYFYSYSLRVWMRFGVRLYKEAAKRLGIDVFIASYYARPLPEDEFKIVAKACNDNVSDIMIAEYSSLAPLYSEVVDPVVKSVLLHDLMAARTEEYKRLGKEPDFLPVTLQQETEWMSGANLLICASVNEEEVLRKEMDNIDTVWLCPDSPSYEVDFKLETPRIVFIGTRHFGNTDAINHFIEDVFPLIKKKLPQVECWIVGSTGADVLPENQTVEGIKLLGRVQDLPDIGGASSVGIAPTRLASGVSIKVAEYLALGMTCVAYRKALEGFGTVLDHLTDIAESPRDFAERTVKLLNDVDARTSQFETAPNEIRKINHNQAVEVALLKPF